MKLKLEEQSGIKILRVTESFNASDSQVLRAGVLKMLRSEKGPCLIVDLTSTQLTDSLPQLTEEVMALKMEALDCNPALVLAGNLSPATDVLQMEDAMRRAQSRLQLLLSQEALLKSKIETLTQKKTQIEQTLAATAGDAAELSKTKKQKTALAKQVKRMEKIVQTLASGRKPPAESQEYAERMVALEKITSSVIAQAKSSK